MGYCRGLARAARIGRRAGQHPRTRDETHPRRQGLGGRDRPGARSGRPGGAGPPTPIPTTSGRGLSAGFTVIPLSPVRYPAAWCGGPTTSCPGGRVSGTPGGSCSNCRRDGAGPPADRHQWAGSSAPRRAASPGAGPPGRWRGSFPNWGPVEFEAERGTGRIAMTSRPSAPYPPPRRRALDTDRLQRPGHHHRNPSSDRRWRSFSPGAAPGELPLPMTDPVAVRRRGPD